MLAAAFALTACEPEPDPTPDPEPTPGTGGSITADCWVISHVKGHRCDIEYKYDSTGRIIQWTDLYSDRGMWQTWGTYTYTPSEIIQYVYAGDYPEKSVEYEGDRIKIVNGLIKNLRHYNSSNELLNYDDPDQYSISWKYGNIDQMCFYDIYDDDDETEAMNTLTFRYSNPDNVNPACFKSLNAFILSEGGHPTDNAYSKFVYTQGGFYGKMPLELINELVFEFSLGEDGGLLHNAANRISFSDIDEHGCPGAMTIYYFDRSYAYYYFKWTKQ